MNANVPSQAEMVEADNAPRQAAEPRFPISLTIRKRSITNGASLESAPDSRLPACSPGEEGLWNVSCLSSDLSCTSEFGLADRRWF
jgi:hypothetical protein